MRRTRGLQQLSVFLFVCAMAGAGCSVSKPMIASAEAPVFPVTATIQDLMEGQIDPAADALWDSVAYIATLSGTEDRRPRSDADWAAVRREALILIEATNLLIMPGREVRSDAATVGLGELTPAEIQARIAASRPGFVQLAGGLRRAGLEALAAIDAKDPERLIDAGSTIDAACEACHVVYWYPNQQRPGR